MCLSGGRLDLSGKKKLGKDIPPMRIVPLDQIDLPLTRPAFDRRFALDRQRHVVMDLIPDKARHSVASRELRGRAFAVFADAPNDVVRDAAIERAVGLAGQEIDEIRHTSILSWPGLSRPSIGKKARGILCSGGGMGARHKAGHDRFGFLVGPWRAESLHARATAS